MGWGIFPGSTAGVEAVGVKLSQRGFDTILIYVESQPIGLKQAAISRSDYVHLEGTDLSRSV
jgi:hypothetical protein